MRFPLRLALLFPLLLCAPPTSGADLTGKAEIVDGETIVIAGQEIRLHGIDAPTLGEICDAEGVPWHCGQEAAFALAAAIGRTWVDRDIRDAGTLRRIVAVCRVGGPKGRDLGAWLVRGGWARAAIADYATQEKAAQDASLGLWRSHVAR